MRGLAYIQRARSPIAKKTPASIVTRARIYIGQPSRREDLNKLLKRPRNLVTPDMSQ
ncbi:hypothetical protein N752_24690 [Desulforamulus aquiferis]|nr:hypothetical protein N752_24690 [Desulforamulus aquiferis]